MTGRSAARLIAGRAIAEVAMVAAEDAAVVKKRRRVSSALFSCQDRHLASTLESRRRLPASSDRDSTFVRRLDDSSKVPGRETDEIEPLHAANFSHW
jgi:hypothetical protein